MNLKGKVRFSPFMYKAYEGTELYNTIKKQEPERFKTSAMNKGISTDTNDRSQFNNSNGNFSNCTVDEINSYINAILELNYIE